jgi:hypothetical protein
LDEVFDCFEGQYEIETDGKVQKMFGLLTAEFLHAELLCFIQEPLLKGRLSTVDLLIKIGCFVKNIVSD